MSLPKSTHPHQPLVAHFAALLDGVGRKPGHRVALDRLEAWVLGDRELEFTPTTAVNEQGHTLAQALVCAGVVEDAQWLRGWVGRHGVESLYPAGVAWEHNPLAVMMGACLDRIARIHSTLHAPEMGVLVALLELAPEEALNQDAMGQWTERLMLARTDSPYQAVAPHAAVIEAIAARQTPADPAQAQRCPERWLGDAQIKALDERALDAPARGLSGRVRPLRELVGLREMARGNGWHGGGDTPSPAHLPELPHGRRRELLESWILDKGIDANTLRARAWACANAKPEVFVALLGKLEDPASDPLVVQRVRQALALPDELGRGLGAFLATRSEHGKDYGARGLLRRAREAGVCDPESLAGERGEGLLEQALMGVRYGWKDDAFESGCGTLGAMGLPPQAWLGENVDGLVEDFIDGMGAVRPGSTANTLVALLGAVGHPAHARLGQAVAWGDFNREMASLARDIKDPPKASKAHPFMPQFPCSVARALVDHLAEFGAVVDVGEVEWRQWAGLGRRTVMDDSRARGGAGDLVERLERAVRAREMEMTLPQAGPARTGPRM